MHIHQTTKLEMAARFINSTDSHLFLTGKAGTGKTTFLIQLAAETYKSFLIVAPTGIAALNAGGGLPSIPSSCFLSAALYRRGNRLQISVKQAGSTQKTH